MTTFATEREAARAHLDTAARHAADPASALTIPYEDFLDRADEDTLAEWVDGKISMTCPASLRHQQLSVFLINIFSAFVPMHELGIVLCAPFQMRLSQAGREPDVLFLAGNHLDRLRPNFLDGPADLVVEIISSESLSRDRHNKRAEYQAGGVPEYWLIDPNARQASFFQMTPQGIYAEAPPGPDSVYRSRVLPGFWLNVSWLWRAPLPSVEQIMFMIAGDTYRAYCATQQQDTLA